MAGGRRMGEQLTVSVQTAAERLGIGRDSLYGMVREGRVRSVKIGRRIRIPISELERFLERETGTAAR
jgi:excisionase family DNA binding protein